MRALTLQGTTLGGLGDTVSWLACGDDQFFDPIQMECFPVGTSTPWLQDICEKCISMAHPDACRTCIDAGGQPGGGMGKGSGPAPGHQPCELKGGYFDASGKGHGACAGQTVGGKPAGGGGGGGVQKVLATPVVAEAGITVGHVGAALAAAGLIALVLRRRKRG